MPRHDAESLFWVTLWAFARARPRGSSTSEGKASYFNVFCRDMLSHKIGEEASRKMYLNPDMLDPRILHSSFSDLMVLFKAMASYLSVPWHLYANDPYIKAHSEHVHTAFRRLILAFLLCDAPDLDIELDTEQPRFTNAFGDVARARQQPSSKKARPEQSWSDPEAEDDLEIEAPSEADDATLVDEQHQASTNSPKEVLPDDGKIPKQPFTTERKYSAEDHASTTTALHQSANALRLKFWKDKSLWFGSGA